MFLLQYVKELSRACRFAAELTFTLKKSVNPPSECVLNSHKELQSSIIRALVQGKIPLWALGGNHSTEAQVRALRAEPSNGDFARVNALVSLPLHREIAEQVAKSFIIFINYPY